MARLRGSPPCRFWLEGPPPYPHPPVFHLGPIRLPCTWIWTNDSVILRTCLQNATIRDLGPRHLRQPSQTSSISIGGACIATTLQLFVWYPIRVFLQAAAGHLIFFPFLLRPLALIAFPSLRPTRIGTPYGPYPFVLRFLLKLRQLQN